MKKEKTIKDYFTVALAGFVLAGLIILVFYWFVVGAWLAFGYSVDLKVQGLAIWSVISFMVAYALIMFHFGKLESWL